MAKETIYKNSFTKKRLDGLLKVQEVVKELTEWTIALNVAFKKLEKPYLSKSTYKFNRQIKGISLPLRSPSIRKCLIKIKYYFDQYKSKHKAQENYGNKDINQVGALLSKGQFYMRKNYSRMWDIVNKEGTITSFQKIYKLFRSIESQEELRDIEALLNICIANLSRSGKFFNAAKAKEWDKINLKKQKQIIAGWLSSVRSIDYELDLLINNFKKFVSD